MKKSLLVTILCIVCFQAIRTSCDEGSAFKNRIKLDSDNKIKFQRNLFGGLFFGPEVGYKFELDFMDGGPSMSQTPSFSFFNLAYEFSLWKTASESTVRWLYSNSIKDFEIESRVKFPIKLRENLDLSPFVKWVNLEHWPKRRHLNSVEMSQWRLNTDLGLKVELEWKM